MTLINLGDTLPDTAADLLTRSVVQVQKYKQHVLLAVSGGQSIGTILDRFILKKISWQNIHIFMADERVVALDHLLCNYQIIKKHLVDPLVQYHRFPKENAHPFVYEDRNDLPCQIAAYQQTLDRLGKAFDVVLLSAGEDGHICSLFPNHDSINNNDDTYIHVNNAPKDPSERISLSKRQLLKANTAILIFDGIHKKKAFEKFCDNKIDEFRCPAKLVMNVTHKYVLTSF